MCSPRVLLNVLISLPPLTSYELHRAWVSYSSTVTYDSLPSTTTSSTNTCHVPRVPSLKTAVGVSCSSFSRQLLSAAVGGGGGTPGGSGLQQQQQQQQGSCEIKLMEPLLKWELDGRKRHLIGQQQQQEEEKEETKSNNNIDKSPEEVAKELLIGLFPERRHVAANVSDGDEDDEFGPNAVQAYISASRSNALEWMASELALSSRLVHEVPRHSVLPPSLSAVNIPVDTNNNEESSLFSSSQMSFNYWDIYSQGSYNAAGGPSSLSSSYPFSSQQQLQSQGTVVKQDGNDVTISYAPAPVVAIPNRFSMPQHPNSNSSIPSVVAAANNISAPYSTTANAISSPRPLLQPFQPTNSSSSSLFPLVTLSRAASELRTRWLDQDKYYSGKYYGIASTTDRSSKDRRSRRGLKRRYEERMKERSQSILEDYLASQQQQQHSETHFSQVESQIPTFSNSSLSSSPIRSASQPLPSTVVPPVIVRASSVGVPIFSSTASFSQPVRPLSSSNKKKRKKGF